MILNYYYLNYYLKKIFTLFLDETILGKFEGVENNRVFLICSGGGGGTQ